ncbi:MAG: histidine kinase dimerization/phosphoacceptor domain -containing protein [Bacteroidota bacterium]
MPALSAMAQSGTLGWNELAERYADAKGEIDRTRALLSLDSFYLYYSDDTEVIWDSAVVMAKQASDLSLHAKFKQGYIDAQFLLANAYAEKHDIESALYVINRTADTPKVHMLIMMAERYVFRPGELKQNLDSAYPYIQQAISLSNALQSNVWLYNSMAILAKYHFAYGDIESGKQCLMHIIQEYRRQNNKEREANWWAESGRYIPHTDSTYKYSVYCLEQSYTLYKQLNDKRNFAHVTEDLAYLYMSYGELQKAQLKYIEAIQIRKTMRITELFDQYSDLSKINLQLGNYNVTLYYALAAKNSLEAANNVSMAGVIYSQLADAYNALRETDKALQWYKIALTKLLDYKNEYEFPLVSQITHLLLEKGKPEDALNFASAYLESSEPVRLIDKEIVAGVYADCYNALKQFNKAEKYYLQMIALDNEVALHLKKTTQAQRGNVITGAQAYYNIGKFYVEQKKYDSARPYLHAATLFKQFAPSISIIRDIHFMLFKIDSAQGNYLSAIKHFEFGKELNDSIFDDTKSKQIAEMQAKYEAADKEKNIEKLKLKESNQSKELQKTIQARNYTFIILLILILFITGIYRMYRLKQIQNNQLEAHQQEINGKNIALENLVNDKDKLIKDKDGLLEEKEWLVKEIHHRVKNNLQIVVSLLNTQAAHLEEGDALTAIQQSRHRIQVISLLHQKLYQAETSSLIDMQVYIREVVSYLKESFSSINHLYFDRQIDAISLDISQAVPVGLILNEAITNCIKYAFPQNTNGSITVSFKKEEDGRLLLTIADNGIGMAKDIDPSQRNSLGMRLMQTLSEQLDGNMKIESTEGTVVKVFFRQQVIDNTKGKSEKL